MKMEYEIILEVEHLEQWQLESWLENEVSFVNGNIEIISVKKVGESVSEPQYLLFSDVYYNHVVTDLKGNEIEISVNNDKRSMTKYAELKEEYKPNCIHQSSIFKANDVRLRDIPSWCNNIIARYMVQCHEK
jgi:hypothetical protein